MTDVDRSTQGAPAGRAAEFRAAVSEIKVKETSASNDRTFAIVGVVLMVVGVVLTVVAYSQSHGADPSYLTEGPASQRDAITIGLIGIAVVVMGAALFLRYSLGQFLRFWLARLIYEQQAQTDRLLDK